MSRPTDKAQLLSLSQSSYERLIQCVESFSPSELTTEFLFEDRDRTVNDVIAHLYEWQLMMLHWYEVGMSGEKPAVPAVGYTWKTLPDLNVKIREKYVDWSLPNLLTEFDRTHRELRGLISSHSQEELFEKKYYAWTGTTSLGAYFISSTSSHYAWGLKKLRRQRKLLDS